MSANNRSNVGKRGKTGKQRRDDSDSFDSRNQYTPYWGSQQPTWVPQPQYMPPQNGTMNQHPGPNFQPQPGQGYGLPGAGYQNVNPMIPPGSAYPQYPMPQVCSSQSLSFQTLVLIFCRAIRSRNRPLLPISPTEAKHRLLLVLILLQGRRIGSRGSLLLPIRREGLSPRVRQHI